MFFEKVCIKCKGDPQPLDNFDINRGNKDGHTGTCKDCRKIQRKAEYATNKGKSNEKSREYYKLNKPRVAEHAKRWRKDNPEKYRALKKKWKKNNPEKVRAERIRRHARLRVEVLLTFGGFCECCGETDLRFLTFDHKAGDGAEHRRTLAGRQNASSHALYSWARKNMEEAKRILRLFCYNCNNASWKNAGVCPHQEFNIVEMAMSQRLVAIAA